MSCWQCRTDVSFHCRARPKIQSLAGQSCWSSLKALPHKRRLVPLPFAHILRANSKMQCCLIGAWSGSWQQAVTIAESAACLARYGLVTWGFTRTPPAGPPSPRGPFLRCPVRCSVSCSSSWCRSCWSRSAPSVTSFRTRWRSSLQPDVNARCQAY